MPLFLHTKGGLTFSSTQQLQTVLSATVKKKGDEVFAIECRTGIIAEEPKSQQAPSAILLQVGALKARH